MIEEPVNQKRRKAVVTALAVSTLVAALPVTAAAGAYPEKPITMVVPFPPGGATDIIGRVIAAELSATLGKPVVIDNRSGAGGNIGAQAVAKAPPDGYTILMGAMTSHSTIATLEKDKVRYDLVKDLSAVAVIGSVPLVFVATPSLPVKSLSELVAYAKANPGKVSFGSSGAGAPQRMASEMLATQNRLAIEHIPYRGSGPAINDLVGGQIQFMAETVPAVQQFIKAGKLTPLAVAAATRDPNLPEVPTTAEAGFPGLLVSSTFGILVPAATPREVVQKLNTEIYSALRKPGVQAQLAQQGVIAQTALTPDAAQDRLKAEVAKWAKVIAEANIKPDE
ncbi:Bug family tripartite tricarboxylate transporter substrate binding protein [Variovorax saccharolyticus]|uniref:Bug family tripartite tricarboxylate transporter substrate binding protein n=1 Tax=Variovorax saccharolyticus TaxID=3053516 RepID=UPI0025756853|nr:tripartite tricarboxylate transporter substrate binding protein [Variovorax sp. J31P216]MDM0026078.1 tripartite tricarboxylate transporter substrate binding protein [Variovorax sp. J31P216]